LDKTSHMRKHYPDGYCSLNLSRYDGQFLWWSRTLNIEVIGNGLENPELLEEAWKN